MIFTYSVDKKNDVLLFSLTGELIDKNQANTMMDDIEAAIEKKENKILLDLENLKYINSSGLNILINILTKTRKAGGDVAICSVNKKINELLIITKLNQVFNVCENCDKGLSLLSK